MVHLAFDLQRPSPGTHCAKSLWYWSRRPRSACEIRWQLSRPNHLSNMTRNVIGGRLADEHLRRRNVCPCVRFELDGIENITRLVSEGLGVSVLPDLPGAGTNYPVRKWPLPVPSPSLTVGVMSLRSGVRAPLVSAFVALT